MPVAAANNRVTLNMFGDTAFVVDNVPAPDQTRGFLIGDLDLLITGRATNLTALAEAALEQRGGGTVGIDLERIFVGWRGERLSVDAGRTHSAEFKAQVLAECQQPGASVAAIALARGVNVNLLRKWLVGHGCRESHIRPP